MDKKCKYSLEKLFRSNRSSQAVLTSYQSSDSLSSIENSLITDTQEDKSLIFRNEKAPLKNLYEEAAHKETPWDTHKFSIQNLYKNKKATNKHFGCLRKTYKYSSSNKENKRFKKFFTKDEMDTSNLNINEESFTSKHNFDNTEDNECSSTPLLNKFFKQYPLKKSPVSASQNNQEVSKIEERNILDEPKCIKQKIKTKQKKVVQASIFRYFKKKKVNRSREISKSCDSIKVSVNPNENDDEENTLGNLLRNVSKESSDSSRVEIIKTCFKKRKNHKSKFKSMLSAASSLPSSQESKYNFKNADNTKVFKFQHEDQAVKKTESFLEFKDNGINRNSFGMKFEKDIKAHDDSSSNLLSKVTLSELPLKYCNKRRSNEIKKIKDQDFNYLNNSLKKTQGKKNLEEWFSKMKNGCDSDKSREQRQSNKPSSRKLTDINHSARNSNETTNYIYASTQSFKNNMDGSPNFTKVPDFLKKILTKGKQDQNDYQPPKSKFKLEFCLEEQNDFNGNLKIDEIFQPNHEQLADEKTLQHKDPTMAKNSTEVSQAKITQKNLVSSEGFYETMSFEMPNMENLTTTPNNFETEVERSPLVMSCFSKPETQLFQNDFVDHTYIISSLKSDNVETKVENIDLAALGNPEKEILCNHQDFERIKFNNFEHTGNFNANLEINEKPYSKQQIDLLTLNRNDGKKIWEEHQNVSENIGDDYSRIPSFETSVQRRTPCQGLPAKNMSNSQIAVRSNQITNIQTYPDKQKTGSQPLENLLEIQESSIFKSTTCLDDQNDLLYRFTSNNSENYYLIENDSENHNEIENVEDEDSCNNKPFCNNFNNPFLKEEFDIKPFLKTSPHKWFNFDNKFATQSDNFLSQSNVYHTQQDCDDHVLIQDGNILNKVEDIKAVRCTVDAKINNVRNNSILYKNNLLMELLEEKKDILKSLVKNRRKNKVKEDEDVLAKTYIKRYRKEKMQIFKIKPRFKAKNNEQYQPPEEQIMNRFTQKVNSNFKEDDETSNDENEIESVLTPNSYITDITRLEILQPPSSNENLSQNQSLLREGIDILSKDQTLLFSRFSDSAPKEYDSIAILVKIQEIIVGILEEYENDGDLYFEIPTSTINNCVFLDGRYQMRESPTLKKLVFNASFRRQTRFNLMLFVLNKIRILLETGTKLTKREIYYQLKTLVKSQRCTDCIIYEISRMLNVGPWALNLTAQKGLVYGNLKLVMDDEEIVNCNVPGTSIPKDLANISEIHSDAYFILVVEKESIFHKLIAEDLPKRLTRPFILITGKGFPDLNTQLFLKKLWMILRIPVFILVDADPDGIAIMLNYRFGSVANAHVSDHLAIPKARWIGVFPKDIQKLDLTHENLTKREIKKIQKLLQMECVLENDKIREQLDHLLKNGVKAGIEGVLKTETYLSNRYLTVKFYTKDLI